MQYFKFEEFECPCCGQVDMDQLFLDTLTYARIIANTPFVINSGYRCPLHNAEVGGSETSSHLKGLAADIKVNNSRQRFLIINGLIEAGFTRIGIGDTFVHVDGDLVKSPCVIWTY